MDNTNNGTNTENNTDGTNGVNSDSKNNGGVTDYYLIPEHSNFCELLNSRSYSNSLEESLFCDFIRLINADLSCSNTNDISKFLYRRIIKTVEDLILVDEDQTKLEELNKRYSDYVEHYILFRFDKPLINLNAGNLHIQDLFEIFKLNYALGNIFKVIFTLGYGRHEGTTRKRELNKVIYFCNRQLKVLDEIYDLISPCEL